MPIVPFHHGAGQVPVRGDPAVVPYQSSTSRVLPEILPTYPPAAVESANAPWNTPYLVHDAPSGTVTPTIDIPTDFQSYAASSGRSREHFITSAGGVSNGSDIHMTGKKGPIALLGTLLGLFGYSQIYQRFLFQRITPVSERAEEPQWVASQPSWFDRKSCSWFGFCGLSHLDKSSWSSSYHPSLKDQAPNGHLPQNFSHFWTSGDENPEEWSEEERIAREIPQYVLDYAPLIHLYSGEEFWPCDIAEHLIHTTPHLNYTPIQAHSEHPNLTNLDQLNNWEYGWHVYLKSDDNVEERPEWLGGKTNVPEVPDDSDTEDSNDDDTWTDEAADDDEWQEVGTGDPIREGVKDGWAGMDETAEELGEEEDLNSWRPDLDLRSLGKKVVGGRSDAPAVLVVVDKGKGVVDAFWFFFYSYNLGNKVFNVRFGNHVGDWEHTLIRFHHGKPKGVFFSEHSFGEGYTFKAVEKLGKRPVGYSATGTHAMYGFPGTHPYILPGGILHDETDRGPLWDPSLNVHSFTYNYTNGHLRSSKLTPKAPTSWFHFRGHWGDKFYPLSDPRQYRFLGQYHYVNGPLGPKFKNLGRKHICQGDDECVLWDQVSPKRRRRIKRFPDLGEGEQMSEEDMRDSSAANKGL